MNEFNLLVKEFNSLFVKVKDPSTLKTEKDINEFLFEVQSRLNDATTKYETEISSVLLKTKVSCGLMEIKTFCQRKGKITYKIDYDKNTLLVKKTKNKWLKFNLISLNEIMDFYFKLDKNNFYYNFIAAYLSQEKIFDIIQIYHSLSRSETPLH